MSQTTFESLGLSPALCQALAEENYQTPTPIQAQAIPFLLDGRDLLGCAQTGTGKTAAFALPSLQRMCEQPPKRPKAIRTLVMSPTRELAIQIGESFKAYGRFLKIRHAVIFGGVAQGSQVRALRDGVEVLIATPGRLLDLMNQGFVKLDAVEILVLDEADRMLDMGFIHDVKKVLAKVPKERQTLLFSATMPAEVAELANGILKNPCRVEVTPISSTAERIEQYVLFVDRNNKRALLTEMLQENDIKRTIIFTRTKHGANRLAKQLTESNVRAEAIHGNKSQNARQNALDGFRSGRVRALVATDIVARGIDVEGVTHVINFELPNEPESYVHRIGRTARAGEAGIAISFCDAEEREYLRDIEKLLRTNIAVVSEQPYHAAGIYDAHLQRRPDPAGIKSSRGRNARGSGGGNQRNRPQRSRGSNGGGQRSQDGQRPQQRSQGAHGSSRPQSGAPREQSNHSDSRSGGQLQLRGSDRREANGRRGAQGQGERSY